MRSLTAAAESWPLAARFAISRGAKTEAAVVVAEIRDGAHLGRGECTPYDRYGESVDSVLRQIAAARGPVESGLGREGLLQLMPPGAARNAVDCALWDLEAKQQGVRAWRLAGRARLDPVKTAYTISLDTPDAMAEAAHQAASRPMLKLKLGGGLDLERVRAVRRAAPRARLIVDANEAWSLADLERLAPALAGLDVKLIEQPLPAGADGELEWFASPLPLCADESLHTRAELAACARRYACVNVKLDKAGGLTEALALASEARAMGLMVMAGSMVATSLSVAPALVLAQGADFVDLDGPLLLAQDRKPALGVIGSMLEPPSTELWG
jgi:L-alanine-DL-glutamate epimerase-like enolase superfamily enzyme